MIGISQIMSKKIVSVKPEDSVEKAANLMLEKGVSSILVIGNGSPPGIITDKDFVKLTSMEKKPKNAGSIMTKNPITIPHNVGIESAVDLMRKNNVRHLLVEENGKIIGILSLKDIVQVIKATAILE